MIEAKVVMPPLGTELRNALTPANQKQGSTRHSRACFHFHSLIPVRSWPVLLWAMRAFAIRFSSGDSQRTSDGVPRSARQRSPTMMVRGPRNCGLVSMKEI